MYLWIRATLDWTDEGAFQAQLSPEFEPRVALWNSTFNMPYHLFRARLKQIAQSSIARAEGLELAATLDAVPEGELVVPIDDDDWISPSLGRILLARKSSGVKVYYWPPIHLEVPINLRHAVGLWRRGLFKGVKRKWFCTTNNYALVKTPETELFLRDHVAASHWAAELEAEQLHCLPHRMSIMNRSLASQTSLAYKRPPLASTRLKLAYWRYRKIYRPTPPEDMLWSLPLRQQMDELMSELCPV